MAERHRQIILQNDPDPEETQEWLEALDGVIEHEGPERAHDLIESLISEAREHGADIPYSANTAYVNTIPADKQPPYPGDPDLEIKIHSYIRWNAMAMVVRANRDSNVGGHIASFASAAVLYDVGFNHFFHAPTEDHGGDLVPVLRQPDRHSRAVQRHSQAGLHTAVQAEQGGCGFRAQAALQGKAAAAHAVPR